MSPGTAGGADSRQQVARRWLRRLEARENGVGEALLIVVAHPDDVARRPVGHVQKPQPASRAS
jgi:hypothetical protein